MDEVNQKLIEELISAGQQQLAGPLRPFDCENGGVRLRPLDSPADRKGAHL
jgi:hypothetical protein